MSGRLVGWAFVQRDLPWAERFVLTALADNADHDGLCWPSQEALARKTGFTTRTVRTHLKGLLERGLISKEARMMIEGRGRRSDLYRLHYDQPENDQPETDARPTGKRRHDQPETDDDQPENGDRPYIDEPSKNHQGNRQEPKAARLSAKLKFKGNPVVPESWELTQKVLAEFNEQAGTKLRAVTSGGELSSASKRIYGRIRVYPDISLEKHADIIRRTLASRWWGEDAPTVGVVYGPNIFEENITRKPKHRGRRTFEDERRTDPKDAPW